MLRLPKNKRDIYFGYSTSRLKLNNNVDRWVSMCTDLKQTRAHKEQKKLDVMKIIYRRIELKQKFRDWFLIMCTKRLSNWHKMKQAIRSWRILFSITTISTFLNKSINLKRYFALWEYCTKHERAKLFFKKNVLKICFINWKHHLQHNRLLCIRFNFSKLRIHCKFMRHTRRLDVSFTFHFSF